MLFHVDWEFVDTSEAGEKRSLEVFSKWQPPEGAHFQAFYGYADGTGGFAIVEAESAAALAKASAPFTPWLRFTATPILPVEEATAIVAEAIAFRDAAGGG
jgi:ferric-dicitrate binding protein FerR (iron transport regulator)